MMRNAVGTKQTLCTVLQLLRPASHCLFGNNKVGCLR